MEYAETLKWSGRYLGLWLLAAIVGGAIAAGGVALGGLAALGAYHLTPFPLRLAYVPLGGLAVIGLGVLVFKFLSVAALVYVIVGATESRIGTALNTESLKSDILSVLDERLAEMHGELRETKRLVSGTGSSDDEGFEFE